MDDLQKAYFQRPLSEAEAEALTRQLAGDEDAALRFAERAREDYEGSALPRPGAGGPRRWPWALGALALAGGLWMAWPQPREAAPVAQMRQDDSPLPVVSAEPAAPAAPEPAEAPAPAPVDGLEARRQGAGFVLSVVAGQGGPARLELRGADGGLLRVLYQGRLDPGRWGFYWDQGGADGRALSPGRYRMQLVRGDRVTASRTFEVGVR